LTIGLPAIIARYEPAADLHCLELDREGMAAEFLAALASDGRRVVTVLPTDQYSGLESFREVSEFVTVCKVALANLGMWVREHYFPASYAHASWHRLQVFFQLPGRISWGTEMVEVELKRFNDRALNRDLQMLCAKVAPEQPRLPDGRRLIFRLQGKGILHLDAQEKEVA
jgi:hypothetical protein